MRILASVILFATLVCPAFGFADDEPPAGDLAQLQGRWKAWLDEDVFVIFEVKGKQFTLVRHEGVRRLPAWNGTLAVDEQANPRVVNWVDVKSGERTLPDNLCIYELHGDTWLLIGGGPNQRPAKFISGEGSGTHRTLVLKRQKPDEDEKPAEDSRCTP